MKPLDEWKHMPAMTMGAAGNSKSQNAAATKGIRYHNNFYKKIQAQHEKLQRDDRLLIEPWFRNKVDHKLRQPDAVILDEDNNIAIVIEVKWNWKGGRDEKLMNVYLPIVKQAFELDFTWPLLVTSNVRGLDRAPLLWDAKMSPVEECLSWGPGDPCPVALWAGR